MTTDIPVGEAFVLRERGGYRLWRVVENGHYTTVQRHLQPGERVHFAVYKGDRIEVRKTYVLKPGDATWFDTGVRRLDLSIPVSRQFGHATMDETLFVNRFVNGPVWLREAR